MKTITFTCETITPMFLSGADQNVPELRPPSIKGALRFWWRAMNGHLGLEDLKQKEDEIFGGTDGRSGIILRLLFDEQDLLNKQKENFKKTENLQVRFDRKKGGIDGKDVGISYLLYSTILPDLEKKYIDIGFKFKITFQSKSNEYLSKSLASFWLLTNFSGLGTRCRRGAGNYKITDIEDAIGILKNINLDFNTQQNNAISIKDFFQTNLKVVNTLRETTTNTIINNHFSSLYLSGIRISPNFKNDYKSALNQVGKIYKDFRERNRGSKFLLSKACLGLPIMSNATKEEVIPTNFTRRSSPFLFSVIEYKPKQFHYVILKLSGNFLPQNETIKLKESKKNGRDIKIEIPTLNLQEELMNEFNKDINIQIK